MKLASAILLAACVAASTIEPGPENCEARGSACTSMSRSDCPPRASWTDGRALFVLTIDGGRAGMPFVATVSISNVSMDPQTFREPFFMAMCGEAYGNNLRVRDAEGKYLTIEGEHFDFETTPTVKIAGNATRTWSFNLDERIPALAGSARHEVVFWYAASKADATTWTGRVEMEAIAITRR